MQIGEGHDADPQYELDDNPLHNTTQQTHKHSSNNDNILILTINRLLTREVDFGL